MKKLIIYLLPTLFVTLMLGNTALAADFTVVDTDMVLYTNKKTVVCSDADMNTVIAPKCEKDLPVKVTGITSNGFYRCDLGEIGYIPENGLTDKVNTNEEVIETYEQDEVCYIFLGDSRTVDIRKTIGNNKPENVHFICKNSMGYPWLSTEAWVEIVTFIEANEYEHYVILTNLGVNGLYNKDLYMDFYLQYMENMDNVTMYYISVNPVNMWKFPKISNTTIVDFNNTLQVYFGDRYINTYDYILENMVSGDGLHYAAVNSLWVYNTALYRVMSDVENGIIHK